MRESSTACSRTLLRTSVADCRRSPPGREGLDGASVSSSPPTSGRPRARRTSLDDCICSPWLVRTRRGPVRGASGSGAVAAAFLARLAVFLTGASGAASTAFLAARLVTFFAGASGSGRGSRLTALAGRSSRPVSPPTGRPPLSARSRRARSPNLPWKESQPLATALPLES